MQNCEVTGLQLEHGHIAGVETSRGMIRADTVVVSVAGHSSRLAAMAGIDLPIETYAVQAFVSEPLKPVLNRVTNMNIGFAYASQTDKGEIVMGGNLEPLASYAQRGSVVRIGETASRLVHILPFLSRVRACCVPGAALPMSPPTAARSSARRRSAASISTPAGDTPASRQHRPPAGAWPIRWRPARSIP